MSNPIPIVSDNNTEPTHPDTLPTAEDYDANLDAEVVRSQGVVVGLDHSQAPVSEASNFTGDAESVARQYLRKHRDVYGFSEDLLDKLGSEVIERETYGKPQTSGTGQSAQSNLTEHDESAGPTLQKAERRRRFKGEALVYQQTVRGLPVWDEKFSVIVKNQQVVYSSSSINPTLPPVQEPVTDAPLRQKIESDTLLKVLGLQNSIARPTINHESVIVYQYIEAKRQELPTGEGSSHPPTLILQAVPDSIVEGQYYVVREVLFTLPIAGFDNLNWRVFIDINTQAVLYLRALTSGIHGPVFGWVFPVDPTTKFGPLAPLPSGNIASLNNIREKVELTGILSTTPQALKGIHAEIKEISNPIVLGPVTMTDEFNFSVESDGFAAVSAYHHITTLFNLLTELGFDVTTLFDRTRFPVPVDHRGFDDEPNAQAPGNTRGNGSGGFIFGRAAKDPSSTTGISADFRIAAHEFGHALLWDAIGSPNFGFAHSAGDAIGAIYCDPGTQAADRFDTFPWSFVRRSHGRPVSQGWAWGGVQSFDPQYPSEQILSTCLFRIYRAIGGDAVGDLVRQKWAARYTLHLIIGGIFELSTESRTPNIYVSSMITIDDDLIMGHPGGGVRKIIRWAFEKQGLFQARRFRQPITAPGAPPLVDVYIDDGRDGEYQYREVFNDAPGIWNRLVADDSDGHQNPAFGQTNHIYVRVSNRGSRPAQNVTVTVYFTDIPDPQIWELDAGVFSNLGSATAFDIAGGGNAVVGPFAWTATAGRRKFSALASVSADGDLSLLDERKAIVSTDGDLSVQHEGNDLPIRRGPVELGKLVPFDNNLAFRTF